MEVGNYQQRLGSCWRREGSVLPRLLKNLLNMRLEKSFCVSKSGDRVPIDTETKSKLATRHGVISNQAILCIQEIRSLDKHSNGHVLHGYCS